MRQEKLEKIMLEVDARRERGSPNRRWVDSIKEATTLHLQDQSKVVRQRMFGRTLIPRVTIRWKQLDGI